MSAWKSLKKSFLLMAVCCMALGIVMVIWPEIVSDLVCYLIGGVLLVYGVVGIVGYFLNSVEGSGFRFDLVSGVFAAAIGLFFALGSDTVGKAVGLIVGIAVLVDSIFKLQYAVELKKNGYRPWWTVLVLALLMIGAAIWALCDPKMVVGTLLGVLLIVDGATDLVTIVCLMWQAHRLRRLADETVIEVEVEDDNE